MYISGEGHAKEPAAQAKKTPPKLDNATTYIFSGEGRSTETSLAKLETVGKLLA
jgi:hypothetical protein